jgi:hypothetical protein
MFAFTLGGGAVNWFKGWARHHGIISDLPLPRYFVGVVCPPMRINLKDISSEA